MGALDIEPTRRADLAGLAGDIVRLEAIFETWEATPRGAVDAYRRAIEDLHAEALRRLIRALKGDPAAAAALKAAAVDEVVYAVLRRHEIVKPSVSERVEVALETIRPMLAGHGGDVELVAVKPPAIEVRFLGACDSCPASALTFHSGVKTAVQAACPEITEVLQVKGLGKGGGDGALRFISPFAIDAVGHWLPAGTLAEIPEGGIRKLQLNDQNLLLSRQGAVVTCFQNSCAHLGFPLHDGAVADGIITCPYHHFEYDLGTGECLTAPEVQLQPHAVRVIGQNVEVRLAR